MFPDLVSKDNKPKLMFSDECVRNADVPGLGFKERTSEGCTGDSELEMLMFPDLVSIRKVRFRNISLLSLLVLLAYWKTNFNFLRYLKYRCHFVVTFFAKTFKTSASQCNLICSAKQQVEGE